MLSERDYMKNKPTRSQRLKMKLSIFSERFTIRNLIIVMILGLLVFVAITRHWFHAHLSR